MFVMKFVVQPEGLSTMIVEADSMKIVDNGVLLVRGNENIYFAPNAHTKYVCKEGVYTIHKRTN